MQVKKYEAATLQEALDTIKRELGPEAIILQTKTHKRGFGLMSKASVEVTAAVSERSIHKKSAAERKLPEQSKEQLRKMPANKQADAYDKYMESRLERSRHSAQAHQEMEMTSAGPQPAPRPRAQAPQQQAQRPAMQAPSNTMMAGSPKFAMSSTPRKPAAAPANSARYVDIQDDDAPAAVSNQAAGMARALAESASAKQHAPAGATKGQLGAMTGMTLEDEVTHLKRMIEEMKTVQDDGLAGGAQVIGARTQGINSPVLQDAFQQLVINGLDKRYAVNLIKKVGFELAETGNENPDEVMDQLAYEIMTSTSVASPLAAVRPNERNAAISGQSAPGPMVIALVGPTGVGKTTTVAKMASEALLRRNLKVGLINVDSYKVAAFDQLATYAKILNVPFRSAANKEDLEAAIRDFQALDVVLVDTTGRSQRDPASLKDMQKLLEAIPGVQTQLVLSATTRDNELYDMATRFGLFAPRGLIISKLDEATLFGAIYNVAQRVNLPLSYFTTGQRVPEDFEEATKERVAALIMDL